MRLKSLIDEDYVNYRKPSMFLGTCHCDWKCCRELGMPPSLCQNNSAYRSRTRDIDNARLVKRYLDNPLTSAVVIGGFEPMLQFDEVLSFLSEFRRQSDDDIVIYTGYREEELAEQMHLLGKFKNVILKVGRYRPNEVPHYDEILGVMLANSGQYAIRLITSKPD